MAISSLDRLIQDPRIIRGALDIKSTFGLANIKNIDKSVYTYLFQALKIGRAHV